MHAVTAEVPGTMWWRSGSALKSSSERWTEISASEFARALPQLIRELVEIATVLHVHQELRGPEGVRGDDDLLGRVTVTALEASDQAGLAGDDLEAAVLERLQLVHLM